MRIAVVHSFYSSASPSGENTVVRAQVAALRSSGHEVLLISKHTDIESGKRNYTTRSALAAAGIYGPSPNSELEMYAPDIVHIHNLFPNWGTNWIKRWERSIVTTLHNYRSICAAAIMWRDGHDCNDCLQNGSISAIKNRCYRGSKAASIPLAFATRESGAHSPLLNYSRKLVVLNDAARDQYKVIRPNRDIEIIPNFVEPARQHSARSPQTWLYIGRLTTEKGISWLLDNWPDDQYLRIIGAGPLSAEVKAAATAKPDRISFLGLQDSDQVQRELAGVVGLIIPSLWSEGIPTVALEALAQGTPLAISSYCRAATELVANGSGKIFDPSIDGSLRNAMQIISSDGDSISERARDLHTERYSKTSWISKIESVYEDVLSDQER